MVPRRPVLLLALETPKEKAGVASYVLFRRRLILKRSVGMPQSPGVGLAEITVLLEPTSSATSYKWNYMFGNNSDS